MPETKTTFCRICEVACGLKVTVEDNRVIKIEPDRDHVVTRGFACRKGIRFHTVQYSPDRLLHPIKRGNGFWARASWKQALDEIGAKLNGLIEHYGPDSVAFCTGSGAPPYNFAGMMMMNALVDGVGSKNMYGAGSQDCNNKFVVFQHMYGSPFRLTYPDLAHASLFIGIGTNPLVSQMTFTQSPRVVQLLRGIVERGGRVVFVNPRRTESARAVGEQVFIRPNTDIFFLLAFLRELIRLDGVDYQRVQRHMNGFEELKRVCEPWSPERAETVTGIQARTVRELAAAYRNADGASLYCATGVNQGTNGTLAFWILEAINAVSGNLDRHGGTLVGQGLFDMPKVLKKAGRLERKDRTRIGNLPSAVDTFPGAVLADEILTPGPGQIRALIVLGANPVLTFPNPGGRFEEALRNLDLLVCLDLFRNETGNHAHYILPCTTFLERPDLPMVLHWMTGSQPERYVQYTEKMVEPPEDVRNESWIFAQIALAAGFPLFGTKGMLPLFRLLHRLEGIPVLGHGAAITPEGITGMALRLARGAAPRRQQIKRYPHGQLLEPNRPGTFLGHRVLTEDGRVQLAPEPFLQAVPKLEEDFLREQSRRDRIKLISKRERRSHNSWLHNSRAFVGPDRTTNYLYMHPANAEELGIKTGDTVEVTSSAGRLTIPVKVTDDVMPGVVAVPHGWGHQAAEGLRIAREHPGVNVNLLTPDGPCNCEPLSGMTHMTGIVVDVCKVQP